MRIRAKHSCGLASARTLPSPSPEEERRLNRNFVLIRCEHGICRKGQSCRFPDAYLAIGSALGNARHDACLPETFRSCGGAAIAHSRNMASILGGTAPATHREKPRFFARRNDLRLHCSVASETTENTLEKAA